MNDGQNDEEMRKQFEELMRKLQELGQGQGRQDEQPPGLPEPDELPKLPPPATISKVTVPMTGYPKGWNTILYNDEYHTFEHVMEAIVSCGVDKEQAEQLVGEVDRSGYAIVYNGTEKLLAQVTENSLRKSGLQSESFLEE